MQEKLSLIFGFALFNLALTGASVFKLCRAAEAACIKLWVCVTALRSSCTARGQKEPRNGSDGLYTDGSSAAQIDNSRRQQKVFGIPKDLLSLKIHPFHHVMGPRGMVIVGFISSCRTLSSCNLVKLGWNPGWTSEEETFERVPPASAVATPDSEDASRGRGSLGILCAGALIVSTLQAPAPSRFRILKMLHARVPSRNWL